MVNQQNYTNYINNYLIRESSSLKIISSLIPSRSRKPQPRRKKPRNKKKWSKSRNPKPNQSSILVTLLPNFRKLTQLHQR